MSYTVAVVGGGQLLRMMSEAASALEIDIRALVEDLKGSSGKVIVDSIEGEAQDFEALKQIVVGSDVLTVEHEHVNLDQLSELIAAGTPVRPGPQALLYAQDKLAMRRRMSELGVPVPAWAEISSSADCHAAAEKLGYPLVVKTPRGGYDGKGVRLARSAEDVSDWLEMLDDGDRVAVAGLGGDGGSTLLVEEYVPFSRELAALVARRPSGEIAAWPVVETIQAGGMCSEVLAPAPNLSDELAAQAVEVARTIAEGIDVTGVLAVELFVIEDQGRLVVNELAMRPHNSGHWTIDGAVTSQFEQHLRAVLDLPLGATDAREPACVMVNLVGSDLDDPRVAYPELMEKYPDAKVHLYGKGVRPGRKLGHVTVYGTDMAEAQRRANEAATLLRGRPRRKGEP